MLIDFLMTLINLKYYLKNLLKGKRHITIYKPRNLQSPKSLIKLENKTSAWQGIELIIQDILKRYHISGNRCIEFGVEHGYSTVVLSNFFEHVIGIDTFEGDAHAGKTENHFNETKAKLSAFKNIQLFKSDYQHWITNDQNQYDLAHVDIIHTYEDTYACGLWAAQHSTCTIFHDTESFKEVRKAVIDVAQTTGKRLYNYPHYNGLAILIAKNNFRNK